MPKTKAILKSSASGPIMNLRLNLAGQEVMKKTDDFKKYAAEQQALRYKGIFKSRPYQPMFK